MTIYTASDVSGWTGLFPSGATIRRIGDTQDTLVIVDWTANGGVYLWDTAIGTMRIYENGNVDPPEYDDGGSVAGHPAEGQQIPNGVIYLTKFYNGIEYLPSRLEVALTGAGTPPADVAPTAITPTTFTLSETATTGQVFGPVVANQPNCAFSEVTDASNKFAIDAVGALTLTASVSAASSPYSYTVRATNGGGSFDQALTINVTAAPVSGLAGDADAATAAEFHSTLSAWETDWAGTVPGGKTSADRRFIRLTANIATLDISNYDFSAVAGVTVFAAGPYTIDAAWPYLPSTSANITTQLKLNNCRNIRLTRMRIRDFRMEVRSYNCEVDRCVLHGDSTTQGAQPTLQGRRVTATDTVFRDNYWWGWKDVLVQFLNTTNVTFDGNVLEYSSGDALKSSNATSTETNLKIRRNWMVREFGLGPASHADHIQMHFGVINGLDFWGNVMFRKFTTWGNQQTSGGFFQSDGQVINNAVVQNNIICMNNQNGITFGGGTSKEAQYNSLIRLNNGPVGQVQQAWVPRCNAGTADYNYVNVISSGDDGGQGPNGIKTVIGNTANAIPSWTNHLNYYDLEPTDTGDIRNLKPKSGAATHWAFGGTKVGAWERSKEIWVDGIIPANVGWPVAEVWTRLYDPTQSISSTYTGSYDADGDNA